MSVSRNQLRLAPYYDFKMYNVSLTGLESNRTRAAAASPTVSLAFGQVVLNATTSVANGLWKSTNNINWSQITTAPNTAIYSVAYGNNTFVAVGDAGVIFTSPGTDGETWTARTKAGTGTGAFAKVTFVNNLFFAHQPDENIQYSSDGVTWALVSGVSAAIPAPFTATSFGHWNSFLLYSKGAYIWFTGNTATTSSARAFWINESSITSGSVNWFSNSLGNVTTLYRHGRPDPGDGLGAFLQIDSSSLLVANTRFVRVNVSNVQGNFQTSGWANHVGDARWGGAIDAPGLSATTAPYLSVFPSTSIALDVPEARHMLYYNEGWYTSVFPSVTNKARFGAAGAPGAELSYSVGVSRWSENEFYAGVVQDSSLDNRVATFPNLQVTANLIGQVFNHVEEWEHNKKKIIFMPNRSELPNRAPGAIVLIGSRAIRPLRTTINQKAG